MKAAILIVAVLAGFLSAWPPLLAAEDSSLPGVDEPVQPPSSQGAPPEVPPPPVLTAKTAADWFAEAAKMESTDPAAACRCYEQGIALSPDNVDMQMACGAACERAKMSAVALSAYMAAHVLRPTAGTYEQTARLLYEQGFVRDAAYRAQEGAGKYPDSATLNLLAARVLISAGNPAAAVPLLQKAVSAKAADADTWVLLGRALDLAGNRTEAVKAFNAALAIDGMNRDALMGRDRILSGALAVGGLMIMPAAGWIRMDDTLRDTRTGMSARLVTGLSGSSEEAARACVTQVFPGAGKDPFPLEEHGVSTPRKGAFASVRMTMAEPDGGAPTTLKSVSALAFDVDGVTAALVTEDAKDAAAALDMLTGLLGRVMAVRQVAGTPSKGVMR
ncbi:MAG: tetratricopeptide repeat protein [Proteobacteria bacterium]|nr:tetratricopeptide repeat protein [Pseudomonadota bacterium]